MMTTVQDMPLYPASIHEIKPRIIAIKTSFATKSPVERTSNLYCIFRLRSAICPKMKTIVAMSPSTSVVL